METDNILIIKGSPRKKGNTARITDAFLSRLPETISVEEIHIIDVNIQPCRGCSVCQSRFGEPGCILKDDFGDVFSKMQKADLIVYSSPIYVWGFTAQMKNLLDRQYCLVKPKENGSFEQLLKSRRTVLVTSCGGTAAENADLIAKIFQRETDYLGMNHQGMVVMDCCTTPSEMQSGAENKAEELLSLIR